jgi:hypothetical protein
MIRIFQIDIVLTRIEGAARERNRLEQINYANYVEYKNEQFDHQKFMSESIYHCPTNK